MVIHTPNFAVLGLNETTVIMMLVLVLCSYLKTPPEGAKGWRKGTMQKALSC